MADLTIENIEANKCIEAYGEEPEAYNDSNFNKKVFLFARRLIWAYIRILNSNFRTVFSESFRTPF